MWPKAAVGEHSRGGRAVRKVGAVEALHLHLGRVAPPAHSDEQVPDRTRLDDDVRRDTRRRGDIADQTLLEIDHPQSSDRRHRQGLERLADLAGDLPHRAGLQNREGRSLEGPQLLGLLRGPQPNLVRSSSPGVDLHLSLERPLGEFPAAGDVEPENLRLLHHRLLIFCRGVLLCSNASCTSTASGRRDAAWLCFRTSYLTGLNAPSCSCLTVTTSSDSLLMLERTVELDDDVEAVRQAGKRLLHRRRPELSDRQFSQPRPERTGRLDPIVLGDRRASHQRRDVERVVVLPGVDPLQPALCHHHAEPLRPDFVDWLHGPTGRRRRQHRQSDRPTTELGSGFHREVIPRSLSKARTSARS